MRPEYAARQPGKQQTLAADHIYITVPLTTSGVPDRATQDAIEAEMARVAESLISQRVACGAAWTGPLRLPDGWTATNPSPDYAAAKRQSGSCSVRPRLAVVIDDLGYDRAQADSLFRLSIR